MISYDVCNLFTNRLLISLQSKPMVWFLCDKDLGHARVNESNDKRMSAFLENGWDQKNSKKQWIFLNLPTHNSITIILQALLI